jgi:predicted transcriptional regulator YheO
MPGSRAKPKKGQVYGAFQARERSPGTAVFKPYFPVCEAIVTLFYPHVEVALHDLRNARIVKIWNCWSDRRAGDLSNLDHPERQFTSDQAILGPYEKALPSQGRSKSITAGLRDDDGELIGLLCINLDVSLIDRAAAMLINFSSTAMHRPEPIYRTDVQQHLNYIVRDFSMQVNKAVSNLSREERTQLVSNVDRAGLFQARKSVDYLAKAMGISRASIYNLLNDLNRGTRR